MSRSGAVPTRGRTSWETSSAEETERLGEWLGGRILDAEPETPATVLLLHGPLGAGKTCFVRGLARGLECGAVPKSPTFALHLCYPGRRALHHIDLYRLAGSMLDELGLEDLFTGSGVVAVEWAERLGLLAPPDAFHVELVPDAGDRRSIVLKGPAERIDRLSGRPSPGLAS
jgi:tRNA threonylcarbamoyladenosine biosynthesis protein TsaE